MEPTEPMAESTRELPVLPKTQSFWTRKLTSSSALIIRVRLWYVGTIVVMAGLAAAQYGCARSDLDSFRNPEIANELYADQQNFDHRRQWFDDRRHFVSECQLLGNTEQLCRTLWLANHGSKP